MMNRNNDLMSLSERYLKLEKQANDLNLELEDIKNRIKAIMQKENIKKTPFLELSSYQRHTIKTSLIDLAILLLDKQIDGQITLTKDLQAKLGSQIEKLKVEIETIEVYSLKKAKN